MRISVVLCTFNGDGFLREQLESLAGQVRRPDEVVVCDDGSADRTIEILEQFAASASFAVRIHRNPGALGPAQNFGRAIAMATGDIISLCDQDDIWESSKLAMVEDAFKNAAQPAFVFSDAEICDANCQPLGYRLWSSVGFTTRLQARFDAGGGLDVLLRQNVVTGATLSFASRYLPLLLPIGQGWMHDGWIALLLSAIGRGKAIPKPLIRYRQHPRQSVGATRRSLYQQYLNAKMMDRTVFAAQAQEYEAALARLQGQSDFPVPALAIQHLQEKIRHCNRRSAIRLGQSARVLPALTELMTLRYRRFSLGWKSFAQDLFL